MTSTSASNVFSLIHSTIIINGVNIIFALRLNITDASMQDSSSSLYEWMKVHTGCLLLYRLLRCKPKKTTFIMSSVRLCRYGAAVCSLDQAAREGEADQAAAYWPRGWCQGQHPQIRWGGRRRRGPGEILRDTNTPTHTHTFFLSIHLYVTLRRTMTWASCSSLTPWSISSASHLVSAGWTNDPSSQSPSTLSDQSCLTREISETSSMRWIYILSYTY